MAEAPHDPELAAAIVKFAIIEGVLMAVGLVLFLVFNTVWGLVGAAVLGSGLFFVFVMKPVLEKQKRDGQ